MVSWRRILTISSRRGRVCSSCCFSFGQLIFCARKKSQWTAGDRRNGSSSASEKLIRFPTCIVCLRETRREEKRTEEEEVAFVEPGTVGAERGEITEMVPGRGKDHPVNWDNLQPEKCECLWPEPARQTEKERVLLTKRFMGCSTALLPRKMLHTGIESKEKRLLK